MLLQWWLCQCLLDAKPLSVDLVTSKWKLGFWAGVRLAWLFSYSANSVISFLMTLWSLNIWTIQRSGSGWSSWSYHRCQTTSNQSLFCTRHSFSLIGWQNESVSVALLSTVFGQFTISGYPYNCHQVAYRQSVTVCYLSKFVIYNWDILLYFLLLDPCDRCIMYWRYDFLIGSGMRAINIFGVTR